MLSAPVKEAIVSGDTQTVETLLKTSQHAQKKALIYAVQSRSLDMIECVLNHVEGPDQYRDSKGRTALMHAVVPCSETMFKRFRKFSEIYYTIDPTNIEIETHLENLKDFKRDPSHALLRRPPSKISTVLIGAGANVNALDKDGMASLAYACVFGNIDDVNILVGGGANVNNVLTSSLLGGEMPVLIIAAEHGYVDIIKTLIDAGANPNVVDKDGCTALILAAYLGHENIVKTLVDAGADPNVVSNNGNTALGLALSKNHKDIIKSLVIAGANTDVLSQQYEQSSSNRSDISKGVGLAHRNIRVGLAVKDIADVFSSL